MGTHLHSEKLILLDFSIPLAVKLTAKLDWLGEVLAAQEINIHRNCKTQHWTDQELSSRVSHLQFFWIFVLFQAGMNARHT